MTCRKLTELVTEYLEGTLPPDERARFETHLAGCPGCRTYMDQMHVMLRTLVRTHLETASPELREELVGEFRSWKEQT